MSVTTRWLTVACGTALLLSGAVANAQDLASDRQKIESWLKTRYPSIAVADYSRGGAAFGEQNALPVDPEIRAAALSRGKQAWERKFRNGRNLASCFPNGGKRVAATYPQFDPRTAQVVTFESAINRCLKQHGQPELDFAKSREAGELLAYARGLSDGVPTTVRVNGKPAQAQYEAGKRLFFARMGARNQACASCHVQFAGEVMLDRVLTAALGQTTHWPRLNADGSVVTLQGQYQTCFRRTGEEPPLTGSIALNNLEYFHTALSNGRVLTGARNHER
jgi:L-cysteine S-thiosulfotransferase